MELELNRDLARERERDFRREQEARKVRPEAGRPGWPACRATHVCGLVIYCCLCVCVCVCLCICVCLCLCAHTNIWTQHAQTRL